MQTFLLLCSAAKVGFTAQAAAGKAGGFLAKDWCVGAVHDLAQCSFELHAELAAEFGAAHVGYRRVTTTSVSTQARATAAPGNSSKTYDGVPSWLGSPDSGVLPCGSGPLGTPSTTAQVHPARLTAALAEHATQCGCSIIEAQVLSVHRNPMSTGAGAPPSYTIHTAGGGQHGPYTDIVLGMGAWIEQANTWLPGVVPAGWRNVKVHSVILQGGAPSVTKGGQGGAASPPKGVDATPSDSAFPPVMLFVHDGVQGLEPEVYPRPCGEVYTCDISSDTPVPDTPSAVVPDAGACEQLEAFLRGLGGGMSSAGAFPLKAAQACYLPYSPDERPIVGPSHRHPGVYIGAGHSCWGILLGPATGLLLAHQILGLPVDFLPAGAVAALAPRHGAEDGEGGGDDAQK